MIVFWIKIIFFLQKKYYYYKNSGFNRSPTSSPQLPNLLLDKWFADQINNRLNGLSFIVAEASKAGIPVPCFSSSLDYINSYRTSRLPQNLVQAMRDCFGSHTYERTDQSGFFHTEWLD